MFFYGINIVLKTGCFCRPCLLWSFLEEDGLYFCSCQLRGYVLLEAGGNKWDPLIDLGCCEHLWIRDLQLLLLCCSFWLVQLTSAQGLDESFSQMLGATYNVLVLFLNCSVSLFLPCIPINCIVVYLLFVQVLIRIFNCQKSVLF